MPLARALVVWFVVAVVGSCKDAAHDVPDAPDAPPPDSILGPACADGIDNDGDGKIDYPDDPGCLAPQEDSEADDCPDGPNCPQCANGIDDDGNGQTDYPADPGCTAASDNDEFTLNPAACGGGALIQPLPTSLTVMGALFTSNGTLTGLSDACGESPARTYPVALFELVLPAATVVAASTAHSIAADTVLDLRSIDCVGPDAVIACSDDVSATNHTSAVTVSLPAGHYVIAVVGKSTGAYQLDVTLFSGTGAACAHLTDCGPGLVCRVALGDTALTCEPHVCADGVDDDGDGKDDYPDDPGCASPADDDEADDCPGGPSCPECGNGIDDDGDGFVDYPADPSCMAASSLSEACTSVDPVLSITQGSTTGDTTFAADDYEPTCMDAGAPDLLYSLPLPPMTSLHLKATGGDAPGVALLDATCGADHTELGCATFDDAIDLQHLAAGSYFVDVDGSGAAGFGPFALTVSGQIAVGGSCEGALFAAGAFTCTGSATCAGPAGSRTCVSECADGIDNNGDGRVDYPSDPGCRSPDDGTEDTVCPGPSCPPCADGIDNDGDGLVDYPADPSCSAASSLSESCASSDGVTQITAALTVGDTTGAADDFTATCGFGTGAPDLVYSLAVPRMATLSVTVEPTTFWEPSVTIFDATCGADGITPGACQENVGPMTFELANVAAGGYVIGVDGDLVGQAGPFTITVGGTVAAGASCEGALFQSGVFRCDGGLACAGSIGSRTCFSACADGVDNDGDGKIDYPTDPGCASATDGDEADDCPSGPGCPQCSNAIDDDGDGLIDYPADPSCRAASGASESFCALDPDFGGPLLSGVTSGNNTTGNRTFVPSCQMAAMGDDETFSLSIPVDLQSLHLDTIGSSESDTVLVVHDSTCATELACDDDSSGSLQSIIDLPSVAAGIYAVSVASFQPAQASSFVINLSGVAVPGAACTDNLFAIGVLTCSPGQTCGGGVCQ